MNTRRRLKIKYFKKYHKKYYEKNYFLFMRSLLKVYNENFEYKVITSYKNITSSPVQGRLTIYFDHYPKIN